MGGAWRPWSGVYLFLPFLICSSLDVPSANDPEMTPPGSSPEAGRTDPPGDLSGEIGLLLVLSALLANPWLLGALLSPDGRIETGALRLLIFLGEALFLFLGFLLLRARYRIGVTELLLAGGSVLFTAGVLVLLIQLIYKPPAVHAGWRADVNALEKNELGFRGHPIGYGSEDFVLVLLGDSVVEAKACAYDWMPERRLEEHLRRRGRAVRVCTLGASGYGQDQELLALEEYLGRYRADLVLLNIVAGNDVWNNMFPTHNPGSGVPKPTFWLEGDRLLGPSERLGEPMWSPRLKALALLERLWLPRRRDADWERRLPPAYRPLEGYQGAVDRWMMDALDQGRVQFENLESEKSHFSLSLVPRSPRTEYGIKLTRHLLRRIEETVAAHQGRFIIYRHTVDGGFGLPPHEGVYIFRDRLYRLSPEQFNLSLQDLVEGFTYLGIQLHMEHARFGPADPHLNEHGVDMAMELLAGELLPYMPSHPMSARSSSESPLLHTTRTESSSPRE